MAICNSLARSFAYEQGPGQRRVHVLRGLRRGNGEVYNFGPVVEDPMDPKDDCKNGGFAGLDFRNQGQYIASIVANENAGK